MNNFRTMPVIGLDVGPEFVDRSGELEAVAYRLEMLQAGGSVFQSVLTFYGIPGIGKTALLHELHRRARNGQWDTYRVSPVPAALTNLAALNASLANRAHGAAPEGTPEDRAPEHLAALILEHQVRQLQAQTTQHSIEFFRAVTTLQGMAAPGPNDQEGWYKLRQKAQEVAHRFVSYIGDIATQPTQPVLLLFDDADTLPPTFEWLEYEVFSHLVQGGRTLIVTAGRSPAAWKRFEVRRRMYMQKLTQAKEDELVGPPPASRHQIAHITPNIIQITYNYPPANQAIVAELQRLHPSGEIDADAWARHRSDMVQRLIAQVIERSLFIDIAPDLQRAFRLIAPLRQFDVKTLRAVLSEFAADMFGGRGGSYFLHMLNHMVDTTLVEWSDVRRAYVMDATVRGLLLLDLTTRSPDLAEKLHAVAAVFYTDLLQREQRSTYVVEWLYHRVQELYQQGTHGPLAQARLMPEFRSILEECIQGKSGEEDWVLDWGKQLIEELRRDPELPGLSGDLIDRLVAVVKERVPGLKTVD